MKKIIILLLFVTTIAQSQIAFKHVTTYTDLEFRDLSFGEFPANCTIDNPLINGNPNLILIVTPDFGTIGPYFRGTFSVFFWEGKWRINTTSAAGIPENTKFNVVAVPVGSNAYVHISTATPNNYTILNHPLLNGHPEAKLLITKASFGNTKEVGVAYAPTLNRWTILNLDLSLFAVSSYNIFINSNIFTAQATTPSSNYFAINSPYTNNGSNNLIFTTALYEGVRNINPTGVWYSGTKWNIYNQNIVAMPINAKYFIMSLNSAGYINTDNEAHVFLSNINEVLCPQAVTEGDREFAGHGPRVTNTITLEIRNTREIWAVIDFTARETVSDWSTTRAVWERRVFVAPTGRTIAQILTPNITNFEFISQGSGTQFVGPNGNSGNTVNITTPMNFIRQMAIVGDTGGNDISTDNDCTDDTRIENIQFFPIRIRFN
jgi:hypothetical protein